MRIEYRWIDYQTIFNDSKYIYYYEILDDYNNLCDKYIDLIPKNPAEYYSNFSSILKELNINKKIRK